MAESKINLGDVALTTFDDGKIFNIRRKLRRRSNSNYSSLTINTEIGESSTNIVIDNTESDSQESIENYAHEILDNDDQVTHEDVCNQHQSNNDTALVDVSSFVHESESPTRTSFLHCITEELSSCWNGIKIHLHESSKDAFNWTIIQTWYNMAFAQFMVPFLIRKKPGTEEYEKRPFILQQMLWVISMVLLVIEILSGIPQFLRGLEEQPNPYTYLIMAGQLTGFLLSCSFLKLASCRENLIVDCLNKDSNMLEILPVNQRWLIRGRIITLVTSITFIILQIIFVVLNVLLQVYLGTAKWEWTSREFLHTYTCYGKQVIIWMGECVYDDKLPINTPDVLYSILGLATFTNGQQSFVSAALCLLSCTSTLLLSAISLKQTDTIETADKFELLNDMSTRLSKLAGGLMTLYMINFAISTPNWIRLAFQNHKIVVIIVSFHFILLLAFTIFGALASLYIDRIKNQLTESDEIEQLPTDVRQFIARQFKFLKIFITSVGIGYPGLYVLNFRLLFSYMGIICSVVVVIHETLKDMNLGDESSEHRNGTAAV
ncbi:unnamed protein product [Orchesella dallaii]|uniref:Uncharacterized protein n=1 Tax=Orchesella dallaii TaxID=48710 RepID=A0ABP1RAK9_9HEXA